MVTPTEYPKAKARDRECCCGSDGSSMVCEEIEKELADLKEKVRGLCWLIEENDIPDCVEIRTWLVYRDIIQKIGKQSIKEE